MAYTFDPIFAQDPNNPNTIAKNATITIYDPADPAKAPITITDPTGSPLPNPITVDAFGMGPAFQHATLDRVAWTGATFTNYFTSYEGMKAVATAAQSAASGSASSAAGSLAAATAAQLAAEAAASTATGGGVAVDPTDADTLIITTKSDGTVIIDPADADAILITT